MSFSDPEKKALSLINEKELVELAVKMGNIYFQLGMKSKSGSLCLTG